MSQSAEPNLALSEEERTALGQFRSFHPAASGIHKVNIAIAAVFTVLPLAGAVWFLIEMLKNPGKGNEIGVAIFGALALGPAIGVVYLVRKLSWKLCLFENGFVLVRGGNRIVHWQDVQAFYEEQTVVGGIKADRYLRLRMQDGRLLTLDSSYQDFPAFAAAVRDALTKAVLAHAAEELPAGRSVAFGKLMLTRSGLEKPGGTIAWNEVHFIQVEPRMDGQVIHHAVVVYQRSRQPKGPDDKVEWYKKFVRDFGNVGAFLRLAGEFTTVKGPEGEQQQARP
jgi:hypothetical protein